MFTNKTSLALGETATGNFHFRHTETEDMLVHQSNAVGVELFLCKQFRWVYVT